jgi:acyl-CoA thioester hydrolase
MSIPSENLRANFKIDIPVRISDINYGGHLGHAELIKITHQARWKFFSEFSLREDNLDGSGVIVKALNVNYKAESFFDDILHISIYLREITKTSCIFLYEITKNDNLPVATVIETVLFMNYDSRRIQRVPHVIHDLKEKSMCR